MIADGWSGFLLFLLLVAPGLLYELRAREWRVPWKESTFTEVSRVALSSLAFSSVSVALALAAWRLVPWLRFDHEQFVLNTAYRLEHLPRAAVLAAGSTVIACALAWLWDRRNHRKATKSGRLLNLTPDPPWVTAFRTMSPATDLMPFVKVTLNDGSYWLGWVAEYTAEYDESRGLILAGPLSYRAPGGVTTKNLQRKWARVVIEGEQISSIAIQYLLRPADADAPDVAPAEQAGAPALDS